MATGLFRRGERFEVRFWADADGESAVLSFLQALASGGKPQVEDARTLNRRLNELAERGAPELWEQGHHLEAGIYELKARNGGRLFWFYARGKIVICSHGAHKPKSYRADIQRALNIKEAYEQEMALQPEEQRPALALVGKSPAKAKRKANKRTK